MLSGLPGSPRCGCRVKSSCDAGPAATVKGGLVAPARPADDAVRVYVPILSTAQPANNAEPLVTWSGSAAQVSAAAVGPHVEREVDVGLAADDEVAAGVLDRHDGLLLPRSATGAAPGRGAEVRWCAAPTATSKASVVSIAVGVPATVACSR